MQDLAIAIAKFDQAMVIQDDNRCIEPVLLFLFFIKLVLVNLYDPFSKSLLNYGKCLLSIGLSDIAKARQNVKILQV